VMHGLLMSMKAFQITDPRRTASMRTSRAKDV
jgi:hypothetical protein